MIFISSACAMPLFVEQRLSPAKDRELGKRLASLSSTVGCCLGISVASYACMPCSRIRNRFSSQLGENFATGEIFVANALMIFYYPL
jgi:hypothetical protein